MATGRGRTAAKAQQAATNKAQMAETEVSSKVDENQREAGAEATPKTDEKQQEAEMEVDSSADEGQEDEASNIKKDILKEIEFADKEPEEGNADARDETEGPESKEGSDENEGGGKAIEQLFELIEERFLKQKKLIAVIPILYRSHLYQSGEQLPASDKDMAEAWIEAGSARWIKDLPDMVKAKLATAEPGALGQMIDGSVDVIGKPGRKIGRGL